MLMNMDYGDLDKEITIIVEGVVIVMLLIHIVGNSNK